MSEERERYNLHNKATDPTREAGVIQDKLKQLVPLISWRVVYRPDFINGRFEIIGQAEINGLPIGLRYTLNASAYYENIQKPNYWEALTAELTHIFASSVINWKRPEGARALID